MICSRRVMRDPRVLGCVLVALLLSGCEAFGLFTAMAPRKIRKIHKLPNVSTAVLVDDPADQLSDPALRGVVASNVRFFIMDAKEVRQITEPHVVTALAARHGREFERMPIDRIGRELGVDQIIHVSIESAGLSQTPGLYQPIANVQVKVVETATGTRTFPGDYQARRHMGLGKIETDTFSPNTGAARPGHGTSADPRGYRMTVKLLPESPDNVRHGDPYMLQRRLAEQIGKQVAWLFVDHPAPDSADKLTRAQQR
jgi:hypothetical protein